MAASLYRSEEMSLCQLFLQTEAAYVCVAELGELGVVQFRDLNPDYSAFQRKFVGDVRRCEEMERKLRYLEKQIIKDNIPCFEIGETPKSPQPREIVDLEATFERLENELREVNTNEETLKRNFLELTELKYILQRTQLFFDEVTHINLLDRSRDRQDSGHGSVEDQEPLIGGEPKVDQPAISLEFIAGVILRQRLPAFERLLWRACRGNVFLRWAEINEALADPQSGDDVRKCVFMIFFQGDHLKTLVRRICEGFRATLYPCPETPRERREMLMGVMTRIEDLKTVLSQTQEHRYRVLIAAGKNLRIWMAKAQKIKAIYHTLNLFSLDVTRKCLIAECWAPTSDLDQIQNALRRGTEQSGYTVPSILNRMEIGDETPPTYNRTNKLTAAFQTIVDSYGVANYREINPAPFTIITFPFLFAVMFGDFGHGTLMMLFALFLIVKEKYLASKKINDEVFSTFFGGRYIILMMGLFSMYTGLVYNDVFSKSLNAFGSVWRVTMTDDQMLAPVGTLDVNASYLGLPYAFGVDPIWNMASNKLLFLNSFKMKMAIIIGVFQMTFGVWLSFVNYKFFKRPLDVFTQFLPQIIFLTSIFVYLVFLIFFKWTVFSVHPAHMSVGYYPGAQCAPSLLIGFINMFMMKSRPQGFNGTQCYLDTFYYGQAYIEMFLVLLALVCVPWMLLAKPLILRYRHKQQFRRRLLISINDDDEENLISNEPAAPNLFENTNAEPFDFADIFIHQSIHTIEFCLGCISHTASYLRLWALSLAHARQLTNWNMLVNGLMMYHCHPMMSGWLAAAARLPFELTEVLWGMVLKMGITMSIKLGSPIGGIAIYGTFMFFGVLTVAVLIVMEGLSAFLHALRLHWVEFQSKFYSGSGYAFAPFSFAIILEQASLADD